MLAGLIGTRYLFVASRGGALTALGTLEATEVTISSEVAARIREIAVGEGQSVPAGTVLVRLDDAVPQMQYRLGSPPEQQLLQVQLDKYTLAAPRSGVVLRRSAEPGEVALPGAPILTLADVTNLELTLYVLQQDLGRIYVGQPVELEIQALPGRVFAGAVSTVRDRAEFTPRNVQTAQDRLNLVFAVKVRVENPDQRLKPGMSVVARFVE
jgi:multidrug resistance efflux pump